MTPSRAGPGWAGRGRAGRPGRQHLADGPEHRAAHHNPPCARNRASLSV